MTGAVDRKFVYNPLDLTKNEIRLIAIFPGSPSDELKGHLFHIPLHANSLGSSSEDHDYEALSYCWGDAKGIRGVDGYIKLDGQHFPIAPNLEVALRRLRSRTDDLAIWIDAICINQSDLNERSEQVTKMRHIYLKVVLKIVIYLIIM
jgi:hypothetical protein